MARNACASGDKLCMPRGRIYTLKAQQPELEISRQRLIRHATRQRLDHRDTEAIQPFILVAFSGPLVDELRKIRRAPKRFDGAAG